MKSNKKPTLLICGDSFMALDPRPEKNTIHWSTYLEPYVDVINIAGPGYSNAQIFYSIFEYFETGKRADFAVIGFTNSYRLEFGMRLTNCHAEVHQKDSEFQSYHNHYVKYTPCVIEDLKNFSIINYSLNYTKSMATTVYTLGRFIDHINNDTEIIGNSKESRRLIEQQLDLNLTTHLDIKTETAETPSFHISNPGVHTKFANEIIKKLKLK